MGRDRFHLALVLWNGVLGGAETFTAALAEALRERGVDARVVFVDRAFRLEKRLKGTNVPFEQLQLGRGRNVIRHPRRFARTVMSAGADGAILVETGYLAGTLRLGGYRRRIAAVEHGATLLVPGLPRHRRVAHRLAEAMTRWAVDVRVAVSDSIVDSMADRSRVVVIPNGVDLDRFRPRAGVPPRERLVIGCMARLTAGKGVEDLLNALPILGTDSVDLRVAGDGPERARLEVLAVDLGISATVQFTGWIEDAAAFWRSCDVAVVPSRSAEAFGLAAAEAMASGVPVVATRTGGLVEVVEDGTTGFTVQPGDSGAIAKALRRYLDDSSLAAAHGVAARQRCEERFDIRKRAESYLDLFVELNAAKRISAA